MAKANRSNNGIIIIILALFLIVLLSHSLSNPSTPLEILDVVVEQTDSNTVVINWSTNKESSGGVDIDDPEKLAGIFRDAFSCNITRDLIIGGSSEDAFKKYGCTYSKNEDGILGLAHNGIIYGNCVTDSRYFLCKGSEVAPGTNHSVVINVLQPDTEYVFKIRAKVEPPEGWPKEYSLKSVSFRML